jgi:sn-glycerol 3-phosphate transport system substrate-binding protein
MAQKLTKKDASGKVTQFGLQVPSSGFPYWLFQGFTTQNDVILASQAGNAVRYDDPKVIEALQFWWTSRASTAYTRPAWWSGARRPRTS